MTRLACLIALACACGSGGSRTAAPNQRPLVSPDYTATRWIPATPTYAASARTIKDVQRAVIDFVDAFGVGFELDVSAISRVLAGLIAVDPMKPDALASIGVDADGGIAVFSEAISPTIVVHLTAPDQLAEFFQQQRARGMATTSEMAGTIEVFTTKISKKLWVSWAVDGDWLWVHFGVAFDRTPGTAWFTNSRSPAPPAWLDTWRGLKPEQAKLAGFLDANAVVAKLPRARDALACVALIAPIAPIGFSANSDGKIARTKFSFDIGPAPAAAIRALTLPPPEPWDEVSRKAALALQWNLDLPRVIRWAAPCLKKAFGFDPSIADAYGVRTARAMVTSFDPDSKSGTGAVALDLTTARFLSSLLDGIPLRSTLESDHTFGPWQGKSLSVPFGPTVDYVLTNQIALAGVGDGVLERAVGKGPGKRPAAVFAFDVLPGGLTTEAWRYGFSLLKVRDPVRAAERLQRWREIHVTLILEGTHLVFETAGRRK